MQSYRKNMRGITLVELMVALALSGLLLAGVVTMFASSRATYANSERLARVEENGRFALETILQGIRGAGFIGCNKRANLHNVLNGGNAVGGTFNFLEAVHAYDAQSGAATSPSILGSVPVRVANSDVLMLHMPLPGIRAMQLDAAMASPTDALMVTPLPSGNNGPFAKGQIAIISNCQDASIFQIGTYNAQTGAITHELGGADLGKGWPGNRTASLEAIYDRFSTVVRVQTTFYFVRNFDHDTNPATPAIPTLYRRVGDGAAEPLVDDIEMIQIRFGVDTNGDREADENRAPNATTAADQIVSATIALLVRAPEPSGEAVETNFRVLDLDVVAPNDRRMRKVFTTTASIRNTAL
jgi:type IV pilus assembly protein PilW